MIKRIKKLTLFQILKDSVVDFGNSDSMSFAASTAFYTIFSMPALLIILLNIGTTFYNESEVRDEIIVQVRELAGEESAQTLEDIMSNFSMESDGVLSNFIAFGILAFSATTVFVSMQNGINHIWHIKAKPEKGILKFIVNRLLSFSMVASIGFIMLVSLVLDAVIIVIFNYFSEFFENGAILLASITHLIVGQGILVVIFALMFKILPDAKVRWRDTWIGAVVTMLLFVLGKYLIGLYMGNSDMGSAYGTAGSLVVLLIWVYYSVVIFLFGGQVTYYIAEKVGKGVVPYPQAVKVELREIENDRSDA
ncbi:YihY/virulence factor BrkB family protein [Belliella kenyensis]|uniref:YihY/virulence factor BrkB family protein n=1 Tax=Belliella kenyensis TaxID=1472724 RepID=A0ABV8EJS8_9BACT|nr:YihY/virulence factor BrkB family protein [Belliella kenyensis]MCH7403208.1 YihY/virulence factor BrkB family protein [Belliella kenyensis]MDN3604819.1 YihY/virulence factor BrkB family protein [Belliella kenyensis]